MIKYNHETPLADGRERAMTRGGWWTRARVAVARWHVRHVSRCPSWTANLPKGRSAGGRWLSVSTLYTLTPQDCPGDPVPQGAWPGVCHQVWGGVRGRAQDQVWGHSQARASHSAAEEACAGVRGPAWAVCHRELGERPVSRGSE